MKQAVVCIAPDVKEAENEVTTLRQAGFTTDDISVLWPDMAGAQELGYEQHTKAPEGIAWGVFFGAILGGVMAYLNVARYLVTPWTLELINAGPVMAILSGAAVFGAFGFLMGMLIGLAFPEYEAKKYERKIRIGSTLVAVHTDTADEIKAAEEALKSTSAIGIHHIEETARSKSKCQAAKAAASTGVILLLLGLSTVALARAEDGAPILTQPKIDVQKISAPAKVDVQKATMPPDLTTKGTTGPLIQPIEPLLQPEETSTENSQKTVVKTGKATKDNSKINSKKHPAIK